MYAVTSQKPILWLLVEAEGAAEATLRKGFVGTRLQAVTRAQISLFRVLDHRGSATVGDLARDIGITSQALGESIRRLERDGLVEVALDPDDSRARLVAISPLGRDLLRALSKEMDRLEDRIIEMLGPDRFAELRADLALIATLREPAQAGAAAAAASL